MREVTQIAFQLDDQSLRQIDELAAAESSSRAHILRTAVRELLMTRRDTTIDAQLAAGYGVLPPGPEEEAWAATSLDGLRVADLDW
jgi:predicted transcriptional regulator